MKALATIKTIKHKNHTYSLMKSGSGNEYTHINNHKANNKSIIVPSDALIDLLSEKNND